MNYIAVCTPARDQVHTNYTYCMVNMVAYHTLNTTDAISLKLMQGTIIQNQRADLCLDAMAEGCTHILFIDSDMTFPQDMVQRLLKHDKEIVAANCARRRMPTGPTAQNYDAEGKRQAVYTMPESTGLEEVGSIGTGIMLIKRGCWDNSELATNNTKESWFATGRVFGCLIVQGINAQKFQWGLWVCACEL